MRDDSFLCAGMVLGGFFVCSNLYHAGGSRWSSSSFHDKTQKGVSLALLPGWGRLVEEKILVHGSLDAIHCYQSLEFVRLGCFQLWSWT